MNEKMTAIMNDQRLMDLAKYKCTDGLLKDANEQALFDEFAFLKRRVLTGKTTISKLEEDIYSKLGVQEKVEASHMGHPGSMGFNQTMAQEDTGEKKKPSKKIAGFSKDDE